MSRSDLTDDLLAARIAAACDDRATRLVVADRPFEPGAPAPTGLPLAPTGGGRRRRLLLAAAAAVAVVGALAGAIVVARPDDGSDQLRTATTTTPSVPAGDWLAPASAPLGLDLESVTWSSKPPLAGFEQRAQLFETEDGEGAVYVRIQPGGGGVPGDPGPVVQGHETIVQRSKYGDGATMYWSDGGASVDGQWQGTTEAGAAALFDQLRWRTDDPMDGFEVAPEGTLSLVDEAAPAQVTHQAELVYEPAGGTGPDGIEQLRIATSTGDGSSWDTVESEFFARFPDGRGSVDYGGDPAVRQLEVAAPGRLVRIDAGTSDVTDAQLRAIVESLVPIDEAGLRALERQTPGAELANEPVPTSPTTSVPYDPRKTASRAPLAIPLEQADGSGPATLTQVAGGRPLLVVLWDTTCVPCIRYLQDLDEEAADHPDRAVVAVATADTTEQVQTFIDESGLTLPVLLDPDQQVFDAWGASAVPYSVFLDAQGRVGTGAPGDLSGDDEGRFFLDEFFSG